MFHLYSRRPILVSLILFLLLSTPIATAHEPDQGAAKGRLHRHGASAQLARHDTATIGMVNNKGSSVQVIRDLELHGRGERLVAEATTDVWAHNEFAYTGTFNSPCGGDPEAGVWIWDVHHEDRPAFVGIIPSPVGSRSNDVKVAALNSGTILVHSNESCDNGPGGFEIYNVDDPHNPIHLASVRIDEINPITDALFGGITDVGVHNLFLFSQGERDFVAAVTEGVFDNFQLFEITDPTSPARVAAWGAEEIFDPGVGDETANSDRVLEAVLWLLDGFGNSSNRFLHDITINADGTSAYLSNWDAGLVLLDIRDPAMPEVVSVALDPENGSLDGEVNSHAAWPSEDGRIVVETEEDFSAWEVQVPPGNLTFQNLPTNVIPGTAISTLAGDRFEANQVGNSGTADASVVTVTAGPLAGESFAAIELSGNQPKFADTGPISGNFVWVGRACNGDAFENTLDAGDIAVVRRGACAFSEKLDNVAQAGAAAIVIANNLRTSTPWGGLRIWDYSDPSNPVLASTFNTTCSAATTPGGPCDPAGTYSVHNVMVETEGDRVKAYISWYWDGVLVLDITDPHHPVEVARFFDNSAEFIARNGGNPHDFWGVFKEPEEHWIFGSDRNGGLYIFRESRSGPGN